MAGGGFAPPPPRRRTAGAHDVFLTAVCKFSLNRFRFRWNRKSLPLALLERDFRYPCFRQNLNRSRPDAKAYPAAQRSYPHRGPALFSMHRTRGLPWGQGACIPTASQADRLCAPRAPRANPATIRTHLPTAWQAPSLRPARASRNQPYTSPPRAERAADLPPAAVLTANPAPLQRNGQLRPSISPCSSSSVPKYASGGGPLLPSVIGRSGLGVENPHLSSARPVNLATAQFTEPVPINP